MKFYRDEIIARYESPSYKQVMVNPTFRVIMANPNCGDRICLMGKVVDDIVEQITYEGSLCVISTVGAEFTIDWLQGKSIDEIWLYDREKLIKELGLEDVRHNCALFAFNALQSAIEENIIKPKQAL